MLQITHLSKSFDSLKAVDDISLDIKAGEIFGLLGPNGAGKTTVISIIASLLKPDSGKIIIDSLDLDKDLRKIKKTMGVVPGENWARRKRKRTFKKIFWRYEKANKSHHRLDPSTKASTP